ncbi:uncharacterized protein LOC112589346 isoform X2 [Harpegnathos saltator]|nr:uncharacterized protein LOC112589346 isoform X2 [Harpegnathos saltator]
MFDHWQQWIQSRKGILESIEKNIGYALDTYVKQAILWSKSCYVCHKQVELKTCQRCFSINYCNQHEEAFRTNHEWGSNCDDLVLSLNIDIEAISGRTSNISYGFLQFVNENSKFETMLEFCIEFVISRRKNHVDWIAKDYIRSDYLSDPLTIYSTFERLKSLDIITESCVIIHVIAAKSVDSNSLLAWEILLHLVPEIQRLEIILINPKLTYNIICPDLCKRCTAKKKNLSFLCYSMLYHDFISTSCVSKSCKKPTMIVGFHVKFDKRGTWDESLKVIQNRNCPLILGCPNLIKCEENIYKIMDTLYEDVFPAILNRNYFNGLVPHRDSETSKIYFRNEGLLVFKDLDPYTSSPTGS